MFWANTTNGKPIPIDAEPCADGNIQIVNNSIGEPIAHVIGKQAALFSSERFKSHFSTCPDAPRHRRRT
jgi:hypothetical protein